MANFLARKWESDLYIASNKKCLECIVDSLKAALQMRIPCNGFPIHWKVELMVTDWLTDYHSCVTYAKTVTSVEDVVKIVAIFMIEVSNWRSIFLSVKSNEHAWRKTCFNKEGTLWDASLHILTVTPPEMKNK